MYDVLIIGAGVTGGMLARELMRYKLRVCILEKENDVACGASKANSGIIHGGFDPEPNTLKARLNVSGVPMLYQAARELNVTHKNNGSMVVAFTPEDEAHLKELYNRGIENGVHDMKLISGDEARALEPNLSADIKSVLLIETAGIICPYGLTIAAVGNAMDNGAELKLNFEVKSIEKRDKFYVTAQSGEVVSGRYVVNCAGAYADKIAALLGDDYFNIIPRAGEYILLDKAEGKTVSHTIFQVPSKEGKGILVTPTADGNLLTGPTASAVPSPDCTETTIDGLKKVQNLALKSVPDVNFRQVITSFSGVRASTESGDFIIEPSKNVKGFIHAAAIDSPGLSSCVAIADYVIDILRNEGLQLSENPNWCPVRPDMHFFKKLSDTEKNEYIKENPSYGKIVCRCEGITEGEIIDAINTNPSACDVDGIKRRTRSGMGRCQGGFCMPVVMELIARENKIPLTEVTKKGGKSKIATGEF